MRLADSESSRGMDSTSCNCNSASCCKSLDLRRPIFEKTAAYGHFGRNDPDFTWEATNRVDELKAAVADLS